MCDVCTWLISGLLDELEVELVAEGLLLQALLDGQLYHGDTIVWVHLLKSDPVGGCNAWGERKMV